MRTIPTAPVRSTSTVVGRNFMFMGLEVLTMLASTMLTTIAIARVLGPRRLGYFNLIMWLTSVTSTVGSLGIPLTTFKYLGEYLGRGQREMARAIFFFSLRTQTFIASILALLGLIVVFAIGDPQYRIYSVLLVLGMIPNMVTFIPSQANAAAENAALNTFGAFVGEIIYVLAVAASLWLHWDLIGIAAGILIYRSAELVVKITPVLRSMANLRVMELPRDVRQRMFKFSGLSTGLMLLQIIVWDRSDIIFLKLLQPDIRQVTFFSVCFSVADRLMRIPQTFGNALSLTQMAEHGRDKDRLYRITSQASVYVLMGALPILVGVACVGDPFIRVVYGIQYVPAVPVFIIVALFSIPKAVLTPAQNLLYAGEDLGFILKWGGIAGLINVFLDVSLIPHFGASGAALANGLAQTFAAVAIWWRALRRYPVRIDSAVVSRLGVATLMLAITSLALVRLPLSPTAKLVVAIPCGAVVFIAAVRWLGILRPEDRQRLLSVSSSLPAKPAAWLASAIRSLIP